MLEFSEFDPRGDPPPPGTYLRKLFPADAPEADDDVPAGGDGEVLPGGNLLHPDELHINDDMAEELQPVELEVETADMDDEVPEEKGYMQEEVEEEPPFFEEGVEEEPPFFEEEVEEEVGEQEEDLVVKDGEDEQPDSPPPLPPPNTVPGPWHDLPVPPPVPGTGTKTPQQPPYPPPGTLALFIALKDSSQFGLSWTALRLVKYVYSISEDQLSGRKWTPGSFVFGPHFMPPPPPPMIPSDGSQCLVVKV